MEFITCIEGTAMSREMRPQPAGHELDALAWGFLRSEFAGHNYSIWTINRRVDAFLKREGLAELANDGSRYNALLQRVMANIGPAKRSGVLMRHPH